MLYIHPDECVDCGACEPVCPVEAIFYEDDVPEQWKDYYKANVEFFDDLGSPGGAAKIGQDREGPPVRRRAAAAGWPSTDADRRGGRGGRCAVACTSLAARLPDFPWDPLTPTPSAPGRTPTASSTSPSAPRSTPCRRVVQAALRAAPTPPATRPRTARPALRAAAAGWMARALGVTVPDDAVLPLIGSKELVAWLPTLLGLGPGDTVVVPELAYPTYAVGAPARRCQPVAGRLARRARPAAGPADLAELPGQPHRPGPAGRAPAQGRRLGAASAAPWSPATSATSSSAGTREPVSVLHPDVCGGSHQGLLAVHSLSKRSNLAGYRAGFVAGDPGWSPSCSSAQARRADDARPGAGGDGCGAGRRRARGRAARRYPAPARACCGRRWRRPASRSSHSEAGLYLWAHPRTRRAGTRSAVRRARHPGGARRLLRPGRGPARAGRAHRDRRADRRRWRRLAG